MKNKSISILTIFDYNLISLSNCGSLISPDYAIASICRLRFNHFPLLTNPGRFMTHVSPYCPLHPESNTLPTSNHIFFQCPYLVSLAQNFEQLLIHAKVQRPWSMSSLLASPDHLVLFAIVQFIGNLPSTINI